MAVADQQLIHECEVYGRLLQRAWGLMPRFSEEGHSAVELVFAEQVLEDLEERLRSSHHMQVEEFQGAPFDEDSLKLKVESMIECLAGSADSINLLNCCRTVRKWLEDWRQQMEPSEHTVTEGSHATTTLPRTALVEEPTHTATEPAPYPTTALASLAEESRANGGVGRSFQAQYSHFDSVRRPGREIYDIRAPVRRRINRVTVLPIQRPELILICCTEGRDLEDQIRVFNLEGMGPHYMIQKNGATVLFVEATRLRREARTRKAPTRIRKVAGVASGKGKKQDRHAAGIRH